MENLVDRGMATIDDARAQLLAGQAARLRNNAREADEFFRRGKIDEARESSRGM